MKDVIINLLILRQSIYEQRYLSTTHPGSYHYLRDMYSQYQVGKIERCSVKCISIRPACLSRPARKVWDCRQPLSMRCLQGSQKSDYAAMETNFALTSIYNQLRNDLDIIAYAWLREPHKELSLLGLFFRWRLDGLVDVACNASLTLWWGRCIYFRCRHFPCAHHLLIRVHTRGHGCG